MFGKLNQSESNSKKRLVYNAFFNSLSWFLPLILGFVATPIVLEGLGYEEYGLFTLILGFISYSFTFGIGRAVTKYVSEGRSEDNSEKINTIISATFWFSILLGIFGTIVIFFSATIIVTDVLRIEPANQDTAIKALYLAAATIAYLMVAQVFQGVVQAVHRFDRNSILLNLNGFLLTIGNIILVYAGFRLNALLVWNLLITILNCGLFYYSAKKFLPEFSISFRLRSEFVKLVLVYAVSIIGYQIFGNILLLFERSWIIRKFGTESLTFYVVPMTLALYFHGFIGSIVLVVFPVFSELRNNREKLISLYQKTTKLVLATTIFALLTIVCGGKLFLKLWINADLAEKSFDVLIVHFASFGFLAIFTVIWQLAEGVGRPRFNTVVTFLWLAVSIPLMVISANYSGIYGVGIARFAGILLTVPLIFYGEKKFLGEIQSNFWAKNILIISVAAIFSISTEIFIFNSVAETWFIFIFGALCGATVYVAVLFGLNFATEEEKALVREFF